MARTRHFSPQALLLLEALAVAPHRWRYGYDLSKQTGLKSGTLYPILVRLADRGLLETKWEAPERPSRPPRHPYRLTGEGERIARQRLAASTSSQRPAVRRPVPIPEGGQA